MHCSRIGFAKFELFRDLVLDVVTNRPMTGHEDLLTYLNE